MAFGKILPGPTMTLHILIVALGAIWLANNVAFVGRIVRSRTA